jgi:hypothetical protein
MLKWIAATALVVVLLFAGSLFASLAVAPSAAAAETAMQDAHASQAGDLSTRRRARHRHTYAYHPYYPYYYGHPSYYSPGPFLLPWVDAWGPW